MKQKGKAQFSESRIGINEPVWQGTNWTYAYAAPCKTCLLKGPQQLEENTRPIAYTLCMPTYEMG